MYRHPPVGSGRTDSDVNRRGRCSWARGGGSGDAFEPNIEAVIESVLLVLYSVVFRQRNFPHTEMYILLSAIMYVSAGSGQVGNVLPSLCGRVMATVSVFPLSTKNSMLEAVFQLYARAHVRNSLSRARQDAVRAPKKARTYAIWLGQSTTTVQSSFSKNSS